jgi:Mn2+/Fe2+ NRAMP family transporter
VDAGKSTLMGHILHLLGHISQKDMHKNERESKQQVQFLHIFVTILLVIYIQRTHCDIVFIWVLGLTLSHVYTPLFFDREKDHLHMLGS